MITPTIVVHPAAQARLDAYLLHPSHALLLSGQTAIGKSTLARYLSAALLQTPFERLDYHPYLRVIGPQEGKSIATDQVRELSSFLSRKVPGAERRVVIIEDADRLTQEAQNALLKTLEEPPVGTHLVLTAAVDQALLPTVRSRVMRLPLIRPSAVQLQEHFAAQGFTGAQIDRVALMSGGLPGLMHALLYDEQEHPLFVAATEARALLQKSTFERLILIDSLAKDKDHALNVLTVLGQMAHIALVTGRPTPAWQRVLKASYEAAEQLRASVQPKLVLTNLMLSLLK